MAEEFQESEVIFQQVDRDQERNYLGYPDKDHLQGPFCHHVLRHESSRDLLYNTNKKSRKMKQKKSGSVPVEIPASNVFQFADFEHDLEGELDEDELVPPHLIVGRKIFAGKMAFSVCIGNGRTLKGRDLSQVRNSILRMTGFLES